MPEDTQYPFGATEVPIPDWFLFIDSVAADWPPKGGIGKGGNRLMKRWAIRIALGVVALVLLGSGLVAFDYLRWRADSLAAFPSDYEAQRCGCRDRGVRGGTSGS